ncbi:PFGI-1 class ICE element type IV pilus protein PilL2 [Chitinimonas koreensis]|uniref:PFGI-1 class ICE element type IV pilus protein PilL2 n=1 Tax=Chitinimonas koreensis TaxID=356302 RepID=UPI00048C61F0|nr:PilL N-terminal domain-containing protein [Chitinimonas koreensis]
MPPFQRFSLLLAIDALLPGCATQPIAPPDPPPLAAHTAAPSAPDTPVPVVRQGRYTLVEMVPAQDQRDLLQQVVTISIPAAIDANVGDALRHVLLRTGYRLCDSQDMSALHDLPLPAAHLDLGPLPLRGILLVLAGPAWELSVDDVARYVCFSRRAAPNAVAAPAADPSTKGAEP